MTTASPEQAASYPVKEEAQRLAPSDLQTKAAPVAMAVTLVITQHICTIAGRR